MSEITPADMDSSPGLAIGLSFAMGIIILIVGIYIYKRNLRIKKELKKKNKKILTEKRKKKYIDKSVSKAESSTQVKLNIKDSGLGLRVGSNLKDNSQKNETVVNVHKLNKFEKIEKSEEELYSNNDYNNNSMVLKLNVFSRPQKINNKSKLHLKIEDYTNNNDKLNLQSHLDTNKSCLKTETHSNSIITSHLVVVQRNELFKESFKTIKTVKVENNEETNNITGDILKTSMDRSVVNTIKNNNIPFMSYKKNKSNSDNEDGSFERLQTIKLKEQMVKKSIDDVDVSFSSV